MQSHLIKQKSISKQMGICFYFLIYFASVLYERSIVIYVHKYEGRYAVRLFCI